MGLGGVPWGGGLGRVLGPARPPLPFPPSSFLPTRYLAPAPAIPWPRRGSGPMSDTHSLCGLSCPTCKMRGSGFPGLTRRSFCKREVLDTERQRDLGRDTSRTESIRLADSIDSPGSVPGAGNGAVNKADRRPCPCGPHRRRESESDTAPVAWGGEMGAETPEERGLERERARE